jgi:hypothetical protein
MRRTPQAGDAGGDAGERIGARRAGEADRRGRGVLLVVGVQDEDAVQRAASTGLTLYSSHGTAKHMRRKFDAIVEIVLRIHEGLADVVLVGHRRERRHLGDHAHRRDHALVRIVDVGRVVIEGGEGADEPTMTAIGCASRRKPVKKRLIWSCTMVWCVTRCVEICLLRLGRQFPVEQQIAGLEEVALLGELLDRVAAIERMPASPSI